jgi:hypothetical protein
MPTIAMPPNVLLGSRAKAYMARPGDQGIPPVKIDLISEHLLVLRVPLENTTAAVEKLVCVEMAENGKLMTVSYTCTKTCFLTKLASNTIGQKRLVLGSNQTSLQPSPTHILWLRLLSPPLAI